MSWHSLEKEKVQAGRKGRKECTCAVTWCQIIYGTVQVSTSITWSSFMINILILCSTHENRWVKCVIMVGVWFTVWLFKPGFSAVYFTWPWIAGWIWVTNWEVCSNECGPFKNPVQSFCCNDRATTKTIRIARFPHQDFNLGFLDYEGVLVNPEMWCSVYRYVPCLWPCVYLSCTLSYRKFCEMANWLTWKRCVDWILSLYI